MVGINEYNNERLETAEPGAQLVADKLNALGYEVILGTNTTKDEFEKLLERFSQYTTEKAVFFLQGMEFKLLEKTSFFPKKLRLRLLEGSYYRWHRPI